jgi:HSP20 family molecular chaperone IbpA
MPTIRWLEEIDRLFDEMVRTPWTRPPGQPGPKVTGEGTHLDVELPLGSSRRGDVSVAIQGNRLVVTVSRAAKATQQGAAGTASSQQQEKIERTFVLPENADIEKVEARFEGDVLRIRIELGPDKD